MPATLAAAGIHAGYPGVDVLNGVDLTLREGDAPLGLIGLGRRQDHTHRRAYGRINPKAGVFDGRDVARKRGPGVKSSERQSVRLAVLLTVTDPRETVPRGSRRRARLHGARVAPTTSHRVNSLRQLGSHLSSSTGAP